MAASSGATAPPPALAPDAPCVVRRCSRRRRALDTRAASRPKHPSMAHRILQHAGRRYSLKLDEIVWETLEELAVDSDLRLNELVARVAQETGDEAGLTNALRNHCLRELRQRLAERDAQIKTLTQTSRGVPAALLAQACPTPCFLIGGDQIIQEANEPAQKWMST